MMIMAMPCWQFSVVVGVYRIGRDLQLVRGWRRRVVRTGFTNGHWTDAADDDDDATLMDDRVSLLNNPSREINQHSSLSHSLSQFANRSNSSSFSSLGRKMCICELLIIIPFQRMCHWDIYISNGLFPRKKRSCKHTRAVGNWQPHHKHIQQPWGNATPIGQFDGET